ncbi:TPM domain-containing protein [Brevibacillus sp. B_LB10_24]|uniref:TPM domain-containing protein n=1 Tax=Brevibacillus sp. B_LB10_24 TaxID=3380645 RepID=UPI0038BD2129
MDDGGRILVNRSGVILAVLLCFAVSLIFPLGMKASEAAAAEMKQLVYDEAGLLNQEEHDLLNEMANEYSARKETDMIILTSQNTTNADVEKMTEDFYDEHAFGYDKPHGNAVILTLDMKNREVYLAGFYKAKTYLDDERLDKIRTKITPYLTGGEYMLAFETYMKTADKYMGFRPGINPDNLFYNGWFQLAVSLLIGGIVVGMMAIRSGGRVTVNGHTYEDAAASGVLDHRDQYLHTTVTKQKIERNKNSSSGGGGGTTSGGHSHSGSRGSF